MKSLGKLIRKQISRRAFTIILTVLLISLGFCIFSIIWFARAYNNSLADSAASFVISAVDPDDAKEYLTTRRTDADYHLTIKKLKEYVEDTEGVENISMVSYNESAGYYVFDTGSTNELGMKLEYGDFETEHKAELINGRYTLTRNTFNGRFTYVPMRTIDDRLAGYVIIECDNSFAMRILLAALVLSAALLALTFVAVKIFMRYISREVFEPIEQLTKTATNFTSSVAGSEDINVEEMFLLRDKEDEIGSLGGAIQRMITSINNSSVDLRKAMFEANHDGMTHVYNKRYYNDQIDVFKTCKTICVIYFDVNNLKLMNDTEGHEHGDYVIKRAAEYIGNFTSDQALCFRMGGDEFLLVMENATLVEINKIVETLEADAPYILSREEDEIQCALAYGYSYATGDFSFENLLAEAEDRMYEKKTELKEKLNMPDR